MNMVINELEGLETEFNGADVVHLLLLRATAQQHLGKWQEARDSFEHAYTLAKPLTTAEDLRAMRDEFETIQSKWEKGHYINEPYSFPCRPQPEYPKELLDKTLSASVKFEFRVTHEGIVRSIRIISSSHPAFEGAVIQAVKRWRVTAVAAGENERSFISELNFIP